MSDLAALLEPGAVDLEASASGRDDAIRKAGRLLVEVGAVDPGYIETMLERERSVPTYLGEGVAIPHGTLAGKDLVRRDALSFQRFPGGVDWDGQQVEVAIGIAAAGDGHVDLLARIAQLLLDPDQAAALRAVTSYEELSGLLGGSGEAGP